ncbi:Hypothetical protein SMAX5B_009569 [Scophthalmus maximus]|uniref:Uncharacterized protein n=1 Tax=Scophthalmus maximus TaxID=52904 RepID=A0A2U9AZL3_SCOMX|nr:Hypothetical protein SMAX5B_009569 [Scophthalmus maximus]
MGRWDFQLLRTLGSPGRTWPDCPPGWPRQVGMRCSGGHGGGLMGLAEAGPERPQMPQTTWHDGMAEGREHGACKVYQRLTLPSHDDLGRVSQTEMPQGRTSNLHRSQAPMMVPDQQTGPPIRR